MSNKIETLGISLLLLFLLLSGCTNKADSNIIKSVSTPLPTPAVETTKEVLAETQEESIIVFVTKSGRAYHSDGCRYLSNSKILIDFEKANQQYKPCSVCRPPFIAE